MKKKTVFIICLYTIFVMFFCAGSSPFIDFMGTDGSVFFMLGRGMSKGIVPYKDLFDHKGWYIYFFNMLGALISSSSTIGIFLIECGFAILDVLLCYLVGKQYLDGEKPLFFSCAMLLVFLNYFTFEGGNITETYALTFILISIYLVVLYDNKGRVEHLPIYMLIHGICVGITFFLRPNMILVYGSIAIVILFVLIVNKRYMNLVKNFIFGVIGIMLACAPPIVYSLFTKSLDDMIQQMIIFNLNYSGDVLFWKKIIIAFTNGTAVLALFVCLASFFVVLKKCRPYLAIMYLGAIIFSMLSVSVSGRRYGHYYECLTPLFIPVVLWICAVLPVQKEILCKKKFKYAMLLIMATFTLIGNMRTPIKLLFKTDSHYYILAANSMADYYKSMTASVNDLRVTVLGNNVMFYNKMDIYPTCKYFYIPSISYDKYPNAIDSQVESILSGENDIIITNFASEANRKIYGIQEFDNNVNIALNADYKIIYETNGFQMWRKVGEWY